LGRAFGQVLETPKCYQISRGYRCGDYTFSDETMARPLALINRAGVFEAKAEKHYGDRVVVSKADHMLGAHLSEFKTTTSSFNFEKYAASCQWRFMVDAFEPLLVTYHVFELDDHGNGVVELKDIHSFNLFPYAELQQDCLAILDPFCDYVRMKCLDGLLRER